MSVFKTKSKPAATVDTPDLPEVDHDLHLKQRSLTTALDESQAVIEFQPDGTIITANDNFLAVTGYMIGEVQGKHHRMFVSPEYSMSAEYADLWRRLGSGERVTGEFQRYGKNGKEIWVSASYTPIVNDQGKVEKVIKFAVDITQTHQEQEEAARLLSMLDNMPTAVMYVDRDLIIRYMNKESFDLLKKVETYLPIPVDQVVGTCIDRFHAKPEHQRGILADPSRLPLTTQITLGPETLSFSVSAILDKSGNYIGAMASGRIMTEELRTKQEALTVGQTVASSTTEMATTIEEISKSVSKTANLAQDAESHARTSAESTSQLQESSQSIGKVVNVIQELADQTNLLALNATIEAARAGESGRSFAVVANEVKELAQETSNATQSIEQSVAQIQSRIDDVTDSISKISESVSEVSGNTNTVAAAIEEQAITMNELSRTAEGLVELAEKD